MEGCTVTRPRTLWTWLAVIAVFALIAAACGQGTPTETTSTTAGPSSTTTTKAPTTETTAPPAAEGFTYKMGIFNDLTTDNYWAYIGPESEVWNGYVLGSQHPALFTLAYPNIIHVPDLATGAANLPEEQADGTWTVTQEIRKGYMWSDGTEVTAGDLVFTYNVVKDFGLGGNWPSTFNLYAPEVPDDPATTDVDESSPERDGVTNIEAVDDYTVKVTFSAQPGISMWQNGVGFAPFMPEQFWGPIVEEAKNSDDPAAALYAASGEGEPSAGGLIYAGREPGAFAKNVANQDAYYAHTTYTFYADGSFRQANADKGFDEVYYGDGTGDVTLEYTDGPYAKDVLYSIYGDQNAALLALKSGEIDFMLTPLGLQSGLKQQVLDSPDLSLIANGSNGFRYLAFNMRKSPMKYREFRRAVGCMIDKEFLQQLLQGAIIPAYSLVPAANTFWANPNTEHLCQGLSGQERFDTAMGMLKEAGFTWDVEPQYDADFASLVPGTGTGMKDPEGNAVPEMEILAPGAGYDPLRSTASIWIEQWAGQLGIPAKAVPTSFSVIVDKVFAEGEAAKDWDWYILGWGLGDPSFPDFHEAFFASWQDSAQGGFNTPGYSDPQVDELATELLAATDVNVARDIVHKLDAKIVEDAPYVVLFQTPVLEAYRNTLIFPFTDTLDGLQNLSGLPTSVQMQQ